VVSDTATDGIALRIPLLLLLLMLLLLYRSMALFADSFTYV